MAWRLSRKSYKPQQQCVLQPKLHAGLAAAGVTCHQQMG